LACRYTRRGCAAWPLSQLLLPACRRGESQAAEEQHQQQAEQLRGEASQAQQQLQVQVDELQQSTAQLQSACLALGDELELAKGSAQEAEKKLEQSYEEMGDLQFQGDQAQAQAAATAQQLEGRVAELEAAVKVGRPPTVTAALHLASRWPLACTARRRPLAHTRWPIAPPACTCPPARCRAPRSSWR
jgi:hypothetical protein